MIVEIKVKCEKCNRISNIKPLNCEDADWIDTQTADFNMILKRPLYCSKCYELLDISNIKKEEQ